MNNDAYLDRAQHNYIGTLLENDTVKLLSRLAWLDADRLYRYGREARDAGDIETAKMCEGLIRTLTGSNIKTSASIGRGTTIAYGGVGVLMHHATVIGEYCTVGVNVTLAAAPTIGDHVYISTGAAVVGKGVKVGNFSVIAANSVVLHDVPPFTLVAGVPAKPIGHITPETYLKYQAYFTALARSDADTVARIRERFMREYAEKEAES